MKQSALFFLSLALILGSGRSADTPVKQRPNLVFILADDLGYGDVGFNGQKLIKTPNIDRLAKEGMRFDQLYAGSSVCAPSRSALMSGLHTGHTYIRGNKSVSPEGQQPIADSVLTVAEVLHKAGYATAAFGKWGLGPVGSDGDPNKQGFDRFYGYNCQSLSHRYYPGHLWDNANKVILEGNENLRHTRQYAPDLIQQQALTFIDSRNAGQPFFLFLPYTLPHAELVAPDDSLFRYYKGKFPEKPFHGKDYGVEATSSGYASQEYPHAAYAAMVARLDHYVGQVVAKLKEKGLDKNTIILLTSDNGPHVEGGGDPAFFNSAAGFRGVKRDLYEGGIRVPFVAYCPGIIKAGSKNDFVGAFWDIFPTFSELAGAKPSASVDGISFAAALTGKGTQKKHDYLYWEFHEQGGKQAVRQDNWKAVRHKVFSDREGLVELFDLTEDPYETTDLATQYPQKAKKMRELMDNSRSVSILFPFGKSATSK